MRKVFIIFLPLALAAGFFFTKGSQDFKGVEPNISTLSSPPMEREFSPRKSLAKGQRTSERFEELYRELPKVSYFKSHHTSSEVHFTPQVVLDSAPIFTEMDTELSQKENLPTVAKFYTLCASNEDFFTSIRAVCLKKLESINPNLDTPVDLSRFPENIRALSKRLPTRS